jgi:hypothetical protein
MTAPFGSLITPLSLPVAEPCAIAAIERRLTTHNTAVSFISFIVMTSALRFCSELSVLERMGATPGTQASSERNGSFLPHLNNQSNKIRVLDPLEGR